MNKKLMALSGSILMVLTLVMVPALGLLPPDPPQEIMPEVAVKIDGTWLHTLPPPDADWDWDYCDDIPELEDCDGEFAPFILDAPAFCTTFDVEIWLLNVTKLYSFDYRLLWNYGFMDLESYSMVNIGEGMGEQHIVDADDTTPGVQPMFVHVWSHLGAVEGFTGSAKVADLVFHITQDPVYDDIFYGLIYIPFVEASGPTTNPIELHRKHGLVQLESVEPELTLTPEDLVIVWEQGKQITFEISVENVIKMKSMCIEFEWNNSVWDGEEWVDYPLQLVLDPQKHPIEVTDFLPGPYQFFVTVYGDTWVEIGAYRDCDKPGINGTGTLAAITLTAISPWGYKDIVIPELCYSDRRKVVPPYTYIGEMGGQVVHLWMPDECHDNVTAWVEIDGIRCFQNNEEDHYDPNNDWDDAPYLGWYNITGVGELGSTWDHEMYWYEFDVAWTFYDFRPISGDLDMSGHVGLEDIMAMAEWYGANALDPYWGLISDFDVNTSADSIYEIDIFDLTVVAKQFCTDVPFHWSYEEPYLDP